MTSTRIAPLSNRHGSRHEPPSLRPAGAGAVSVAFDVPCELPDGTVLRANVYSPEEPSELPVIVVRHPYDKDNPGVMSAYLNPLRIARAGYIVVVQDVRGRFHSDGVFRPTVDEQADGAAVIEWASTLPGSNGRVGTLGGSYGAEVQWSAALARPEALESMIVAVSPSHSAFTGFLFRGGALEFGSRLGWAHSSIASEELRRQYGDDDVGGVRARESHAAMRTLFDSGTVYRIRPLSDLPPIEPFVVEAASAFRHRGEDRSLTAGKTAGRYSEIRPSVFLIGGWYDVFLGSTILQYRGVLEQARAAGRPQPHLVIGPWSHSDFSDRSGQLSFGTSASSTTPGVDLSLVDQEVRWFDAALKDARGELDGVAPVRVFVMGRNEWRELEEFPPPDAAELDLYVGGDGGLVFGTPARDEAYSYIYDPADPVPSTGGATLLPPPYAPGAWDQSPLYCRDDVLSFTSAALPEAIDVIGAVRVVLFASSTAVDTDFVARLCDVHPDGRSIVIADGIIRASWRNHDGLDAAFEPEPIVPGEIYEFHIDLWATANSFLPGHRIRLDLTSSSFPRWDPNPNTGGSICDSTENVIAQQTVYSGPGRRTRIVLPVVG